MTLTEADALLRRYPEAGRAERLLSHSPRPFSAASVVATPGGRVFVKRHHVSVRDPEGLLEEHRFIAHLRTAHGPLGDLPVARVLSDADGQTAVRLGEWTYEVHHVAAGVDLYEQALSWTPFLDESHARAAGRALAKLHLAAQGYAAPRRASRPLVSSFTIFAGAHESAPEGRSDEPAARMEAYLDARPALRAYANRRGWRSSLQSMHLPFYESLRSYLPFLRPLWTHNDFHASNLMWGRNSAAAEVTAIIDFGLADRTNAIHDLATTIERNVIEWLRMDEPGAALVHFKHADALLAGYEEIRPLSYEEARALPAMLPLVHCEFALSETDYFLSVLHSEERAFLAYEGYFLAHTAWFRETEGRRLLEQLRGWAEGKPNADLKASRGNR